MMNRSISKSYDSMGLGLKSAWNFAAKFRREIYGFRGEISRRNTAKKVYLLLRIKIN